MFRKLKEVKEQEEVGPMNRPISQVLEGSKNTSLAKGTSMIDTVVGTNTKIIGDIISDKDVRVDGIIEGELHIQGKVVIGQEAKVLGDIKAHTVIIYGKVQGDIKTTELIEIMESGHLVGNIETRYIEIRKGGIFEGISKVIKEGQNVSGNTKKQGKQQELESSAKK